MRRSVVPRRPEEPREMSLRTVLLVAAVAAAAEAASLCSGAGGCNSSKRILDLGDYSSVHFFCFSFLICIV